MNAARPTFSTFQAPLALVRRSPREPNDGYPSLLPGEHHTSKTLRRVIFLKGHPSDRPLEALSEVGGTFCMPLDWYVLKLTRWRATADHVANPRGSHEVHWAPEPPGISGTLQDQRGVQRPQETSRCHHNGAYRGERGHHGPESRTISPNKYPRTPKGAQTKACDHFAHDLPSDFAAGSSQGRPRARGV